MASQCSRSDQRRRAIASRRATVERVEAYVRAHLDTPIPVSKLCQIVGLSERGLRNAFYGVHGVGPKRWMLAERLLGAQTALSEPQSLATTVTGVATDYGFYQLGRFAAIYRETFGEAPSVTLRAASRTGGRSTMEHEKVHPDVRTS